MDTLISVLIISVFVYIVLYVVGNSKGWKWTEKLNFWKKFGK